jgi:hypothetical protein
VDGVNQEDDPISIEGAARLAGYKRENKSEHEPN